MIPKRAQRHAFRGRSILSLRGRKPEAISRRMGVAPVVIPAYAESRLDPGSESGVTNDRQDETASEFLGTAKSCHD